MSDPLFDGYSSNYTEVINETLALTGGNRSVFALHRVLAFKDSVAPYVQKSALRVLDFGCGDGATSVLLSDHLNAEVVGTDSSEKSLKAAQARHSGTRVRFVLENELSGLEPFDLAYCNGVFHHVPPAHRHAVLTQIKNSLRPGGFFALFENTPWNPGTRLVMRKIPFDADAVVLGPRETKRLLRQCGLQALKTNYLFTLPPFLGPLFRLDKYFRRWPTGGQYFVLSRKPR